LILAKDCLNSARELAVAANFSSSSKIVGLVILPIISSISEEISPNRALLVSVWREEE
jgi:ABC-type phosphate transport system permease subunit